MRIIFVLWSMTFVLKVRSSSLIEKKIYFSTKSNNFMPEQSVTDRSITYSNAKRNNIMTNNLVILIPIDQSECPACSCGALGKESRIVGGKPTYFNKYPWMAILLYHGKFLCGGTVINDKYVITAAHCVHKSFVVFEDYNNIFYKKEGFIVRLLEYDQTQDKDDITFPIELHVSRIIKNEFNIKHKENDIALLRLDTEGIEFGLNTGLNPVCLPVKDEDYAGYEGIVTGWGREKQKGDLSSILREINVPIISNVDCKKTAYEDDILESTMCVGYLEGQKDACNGDSGGPMHIVQNSAYHIVGIVSWGHGCAQPNRPGVYTRVNSYLDWIANFTADACSCTNIYTPPNKNT